MSTLKERANIQVNNFLENESMEDKYLYIINQGKKLAPINPKDKIEKNLIRGCQSQVWLTLSKNGDGRLIFSADSDASITKGIVAILLNIYSGSFPSEILNMKTDFIDTMDLRKFLSMNRSNGLTAMLKQIVMFAMVFNRQDENKFL